MNNCDCVLRIENVSKWYGKKKVLENVNFQVKKGEIVGLLGKNGAGKTTLIRIISGILPNYSGDVYLFNNNIKENNIEAQRRMGVLLEPAFFESMSAIDNLKYLSEVGGTGTISSGLDKLLEMVGLADSKKQKVSSFSFGMKQRLGLAQAMLCNPEFLLMDEPTIGLDPIGIKEIENKLIRHVRINKGAILLSSHQLKNVQDICDRIILLDERTVKMDAAVAQLSNNLTNLIYINNSINRKEVINKICKNLGISFQNGFFEVKNKDLNALIESIVINKISIKKIDIKNNILFSLFEK
jgi:ABC-2 type transport system ATP-binding protein